MKASRRLNTPFILFLGKNFLQTDFFTAKYYFLAVVYCLFFILFLIRLFIILYFIIIVFHSFDFLKYLIELLGMVIANHQNLE